MSKFLGYFFVLFFLSFQSLSSELKTTYQDNSPVKYNFDNSSSPGICTEVIEEIEKIRPGLRFHGKNKKMSLARIESFLESSDLDIFFCLLKTPEREKRFRFIDLPIYEVNNIILVKNDDDILKEVKNLRKDLKFFKDKGKFIVNKGSILVEDLKRIGASYLDGTRKDLEILEMLNKNRARFFYTQDFAIAYSLKNAKQSGNYKIIQLDRPSGTQNIAYSPKADSKLIKEVESALRELVASGKLKAIINKYKEEIARP